MMIRLYKRKKKDNKHLNSSLPLISNTKKKIFEDKINISSITKLYCNDNEDLVKNLDLEDPPNYSWSKGKLLYQEIINKKNSNLRKSRKINLGKFNQKIEEAKVKELNKRFALQKIKASQKEALLNTRLTNLKKQLGEIKQEKENILNQIKGILLDNEEKLIFIDAINLNNKAKDTFLTKYNLESHFNPTTESQNFSVLHSMNKNFGSVQQTKSSLNQNIEENNKKLLELNKALNDKKKDYQTVKKQIIKEKNELVNYYNSILIEGIDSRKEGLSWIIRAIWNLGEDVNMRYLPNFLDEKAIDFLFSIARKYDNIDKLKSKIHNLRKQMLFIEQYQIKTNPLQLTKNNSSLRSSQSLSLCSSKKGKDFMKEMKKHYDDLEKADSFSYRAKCQKGERSAESKIENLIMLVKKLEATVEISENEIKHLNEQEMIRITKEFLENDYEKRFQTTQDIVIGALIGEENKKTEFIKQEKVKKVKNFSFIFFNF